MTLREVERPQAKGERIAKIARSFSCVDESAPIHEILAEMKEPYENAIAVVDGRQQVRGLIVPRDLVEMLGKPFGRDLLQRQKAADIMSPVRTFLYDEYIQAIRDRIRGDLEKDSNTHYVLVDERNVFRGHFSSQDILLHAMNDQERELAIATAIQNRLVHPYVAIRNDRLSITCSSVMAQGVGGDYYFIKEYEPGKWFFCLCDISGKGISAAIITAVLSGFMYNADFSGDVDELVRKLNDIILDTFKLEKYLTGFFAKFAEKTGFLEYCDMGHSWFYVIDGPSIQQIADQADNVPVGLVENPEVTTRFLRIAPGTALALISDGIVEQENRSREPFPIAEMGRIIGESIRDGEDLVKAKIRILETFFAFKKDMPQHDDISLLLFHYAR
jgi:sigma-B regulation protein RsbU (phosphoserine phosphatase)